MSENLTALLGLRQALGAYAGNLGDLLGVPIGVFFFLLLLRIVLRRQRLAYLVMLALYAFALSLIEGNGPFEVLGAVLGLGTLLFVLVRFGLLAGVSTAAFDVLRRTLPPPADLSTWYAVQSILPLVGLAALAVWGFHISRAGRPLFGSLLDEEHPARPSHP